MDPVPLIGRYPYSHWVLGARPGGIESYRSLPPLGVLPCDRGNLGSPPWLLRFVTPDLSFIRTQDTVTSHAFQPFHSQLRPVSSRFEESLEDSQSRGPFGLPPNPSPSLPSDHPSCNILLNASHNTLLQSGNHAHMALYRAYLQVQAENRGLK